MCTQIGTGTIAHIIARTGDTDKLGLLLEKQGDLVQAKDQNGWMPLHEGVRAGHVDVVELLVKKGSNVNERTNHGIGGTALWLALEEHGEDHPMTQFLQTIGAISIGPEL